MLYKLSWAWDGDEYHSSKGLCVSSMRGGHANILYNFPSLTDDPRRESMKSFKRLLVCFIDCTTTYEFVQTLVSAVACQCVCVCVHALPLLRRAGKLARAGCAGTLAQAHGLHHQVMQL